MVYQRRLQNGGATVNRTRVVVLAAGLGTILLLGPIGFLFAALVPTVWVALRVEASIVSIPLAILVTAYAIGAPVLATVVWVFGDANRRCRILSVVQFATWFILMIGSLGIHLR